MTESSSNLVSECIAIFLKVHSITLIKSATSLLSSQSNVCALFHADSGFKEHNTPIRITKMIFVLGAGGVTSFRSVFSAVDV